MKSTQRSSVLFALAFLFVASPVRAAVVINEVMYDPLGSDSGREWVELHNDGTSDVTLVGGSGSGSWRIADSSNHTLVAPPGNGGRGSLVVPAGGYLVIANDPATFIAEYGGAYSVVRSALTLNNTGVTVSLVDGSSGTVDSFSYTAAMGGSDSGTSLQLSAAAWLQALPTPGAANAASAYVPPANDDNEEKEEGSSQMVPASSVIKHGYVSPPTPEIFADAGENRTVIVGADVKFVARAYDRDKEIINYAKFLWNFGDGSVDRGPVVMHNFAYPGRYTVGLVIQNDEFRTQSRITVEALPASTTLSALPGGGIAIQNLSGRDLDLSFWKIGQGSSEFVLPEHSVVLKDSALNISAPTLGFAAAGAELRYPNGTAVASAQEPPPAAAKAVLTTQTVNISAKTPVLKPAATPKAEPLPEPEAVEEILAREPPREALVASVAQTSLVLPQWASWGALGGLIGLGLAALMHVRRLREAGTETPPGPAEFQIE